MTTETAAPPPYRLDVHPDAGSECLEQDVRRGLAAEPKSLPPKYFYDEAGSELFERITELPEYYQSRSELGILERIAPEMATRHGLTELVELGSGASRKTRALLDAMLTADGPHRYIPFDVCPEAILAAAGRLSGHYARLEIHGVAGDFARHLPQVPPKRGGARLIAFLGGTIGNLEPRERSPFLRAVAGLMDRDDLLLVGTDLAGDPDRIVPAYDDAAGITERFNLNLLRVLNRELGSDFDLNAFAHEAVYRLDPPRVEMHLRSLRHQIVRFDGLGMEVPFARDERIRTEISCKFTRDAVADMYAQAGMEMAEWHEDERGWFAVSLARLAD